MTKHRIVRLLFVLLLWAIFFADLKWDWPGYVYLLAILAYGFILFLGSYFIQLGYFVESVCKGDSTKKQIAITFDDGPMREFTPRVLDILKEEKVPAAFFLIGKNIQGNEDIVKRLVDEGHVIGNHSFEHGFWFSIQSTKKMAADARNCDNAIAGLTGYMPKLFRPPYGVTNPMVADMIKARGYHSIGWSVRTYDTNAVSAEALLKKSLKNLSNGDVVLFHDWAPHTIGILSEFIRQARIKGFEFIRVDELLKVDAYYLPNNEGQDAE